MTQWQGTAIIILLIAIVLILLQPHHAAQIMEVCDPGTNGGFAC
jgi:preprotein translocase subunit SecG